MAIRAIMATGAALLSMSMASAASAQDAAESAIILSGTGQATGSAQRGLGSSVSSSINRASNALRATRNARNPSGRRSSRATHQSHAIPAGVDFLEGTDAPTYQLGNGSSIRVSGGLRQTPETACVKDCPEAPPKER